MRPLPRACREGIEFRGGRFGFGDALAARRRRRLRRRYRPRGDVAAGRGRAGRRLPPDRALIRRLLCGEHSREKPGRTGLRQSGPPLFPAFRSRSPAVSRPRGCGSLLSGDVTTFRACPRTAGLLLLHRFLHGGISPMNLAKVSRERPKWRQMSPMERSSFSISITAVRFSMSTCNLV